MPPDRPFNRPRHGKPPNGPSICGHTIDERTALLQLLAFGFLVGQARGLL